MMFVRRALRAEKEERWHMCSRRRTRESWWSLFMCVMMRFFATASWAVGSVMSLGFLVVRWCWNSPYNAEDEVVD